MQRDPLERISQERHGAIRLGTGVELAMMRRVFAVLGMSRSAITTSPPPAYPSTLRGFRVRVQDRPR
jgi:hypothetical protein